MNKIYIVLIVVIFIISIAYNIYFDTVKQFV